MNPFNFKHYKIQEVGLYKDGMPYPCQPMRLDFVKKRWNEGYHNFMKSLGGAYNKTFTPAVTRLEYGNGFTLFSYDMSPDQMGSVSPATLQNNNSNVRLEMKFGVALPENVTLLVYSEIENLMEIHRDRRVTINF